MAAQAAAFQPARRHYPGIRAPLPSDYFAQVRRVLATVLQGVFEIPGSIRILDASYSIVTTPPRNLSIEQRIPHVDAVDVDRLALVHFLSHDGDGTAFYRHRATGYETVDAHRSDNYFARLNAELKNQGAPPPAYIHDTNVQFERIAGVEARYNRAVIYRGMQLHSGAINPEASLDANSETGRLTITAFLTAGQDQAPLATTDSS